MKKKFFVMLATAVTALTAFAVTACSPTEQKPPELTRVGASDVTCTKDGNIEYWTDGVKYFADADGQTELSADDVFIRSTGHKPASSLSHDASGHWHACTECGDPADAAVGHTDSAWKIDETSNRHYKECTECGETTVAKADHTESDWLVDTEANKHYKECTVCHAVTTEKVDHTPETELSHDASGHWYECSVCGAVTTAKVGHTESGWINDGNGKHYKECTVCHEVTTAATAHTEAWQHGDGKHWTVCPDCGAESEKQDHTESGWLVDTEANKHYKDCTVCHEITTEKADHTPAEQWSTDGAQHWHECEVCDAVIGEKTDHTPESGFVTTDPDYHWKECSVCHDVVGQKTAHDFDWVTDTPAAEETDGVKHEECDCGARRNENTTIPALGRTIHHEANDPTCTEDGNIEYWEKGGVFYSNAECTDVIEDQESVVREATGHTAASDWSHDANGHWHACAVCGEAADTAVSHTESGWLVDTETDQHYKECTVCHEITTAKADHTASEWRVDGDEHYKDCTVCGTIVSEKTAHTEETFSDETAHGKKCSVCQTVIESEEHSYIAAVTAPTCTEDGYTTHTCECGKSYTDTEVDALGHDYSKSVYVQSDNKFYYICATCGDTGDEISVDNNLKTSINDVEYTPTSCYSEENNGVTFDAVNKRFVFTIDGNYSGDLKIHFNTGSCVEIKVAENATVDSITLTTFGTMTDEYLLITGDKKLTVAGSVNTGTRHLMIECDVDIMNSVSAVHSLIIGKADNSVSPTVAITATANGEGINSSNDVDLSIQVLSGTLSIMQPGSGNCGLSLHREGDSVIVGEHGTLVIKNFAAPIVSWGGPSRIEIKGVLEVENTEDGAIRNVALSILENGRASIKGVKGITGGSVTVNGENAALKIESSQWGMESVAVRFIAGSAEFTRDSNGFASFCSLSAFTVQNDFKLYVTNYSQIVFGDKPAEFDIADGTLYLTNINQLSQNGVITESMIASKINCQ